MEVAFIRQSKPVPNAYVERFWSRFRQECLTGRNASVRRFVAALGNTATAETQAIIVTARPG